MSKPLSQSKKSSRSSLLRWASALGLGTAACAAALSLAVGQPAARAESPTTPGKTAAPATAGDMKPFTQDIPGRADGEIGEQRRASGLREHGAGAGLVAAPQIQGAQDAELGRGGRHGAGGNARRRAS